MSIARLAPLIQAAQDVLDYDMVQHALGCELHTLWTTPVSNEPCDCVYGRLRAAIKNAKKGQKA